LKGFVLVELLIALAILSIVFFYLTPVSVNIFKSQKNLDVDKLNSIVQLAYKKAKSSGLPQVIWGLKGSNNIHFDRQLFYISKDVFDVKVNSLYQEGEKYIFFVYPAGIMDKVSLTLFGDKKIISYPLLLRFEIE